MSDALSSFMPAIPISDILAFSWFMACWIGFSLITDRRGAKMRLALRVLHGHRVRWMERMLGRDNRMADVNILTGHIRSGELFASVSILIMAGIMTILGNLTKAREVVSNLSFTVEASLELWEIKVIILLFIFVYAFFKFAWCLRQFNYALIFIGSAPLREEVNASDREAYPERGATLIDLSLATFNRGVRSYYFGLAALAWFLSPMFMALAAIWVVAVLYRRDYRAAILKTLMEPDVSPIR